MLVVLVILALAAGLAGPTLRSILPSRRLDAAADAVADELTRLRSEAIRTGRRASLVYDSEAARFLSSPPAVPPLAMGALAVSVDTPAESRARAGEIRFLPGGGASGGRIVLAGSAGRRVLTVSRVTGAVRRGEAVP